MQPLFSSASSRATRKTCRASRSSGRPASCSTARSPEPASTATRVYVTNAVKHFKFEPRGKRRIHKTPNNAEIEHCRWWLERELDLIKPKLVVAMGATAARSLTGRTVTITHERGQLTPVGAGYRGLITVHPSYILRLQGEAAKAAEFQRFVADLRIVTNELPAIRT